MKACYINREYFGLCPVKYADTPEMKALIDHLCSLILSQYKK